MPTMLAIAGIGAGIAGTGVSMYAQHQQGTFEKGMMNYQAGLARERANLAQQNAAIQSMRLSAQRRQAAAAGTAGFAANGLLIDDGGNSAPKLWEQDMAAETAWQKEELKTKAMYEAWGYNANADALIAQGSMAKKAAALGMWGTGLSGAGSVLMMGSSLTAPASSGGGTTTANYAGDNSMGTRAASIA